MHVLYTRRGIISTRTAGLMTPDATLTKTRKMLICCKLLYRKDYSQKVLRQINSSLYTIKKDVIN
jgi:hypothetical protein